MQTTPSSSTTTSNAEDKTLVLALCKKLLHSLEHPGDSGREMFLSTLAPRGLAIHARAHRASSPSGGLGYEEFRDEFAARIPWDGGRRMLEGIDGEATVLVDHDIGMVWTPYYFLNDDVLTHVGTNCFTLVKRDWQGNGEVKWLVVGMTDTAREPSEEDKKKYGPKP